jgi:hypothetical protein
MLILEDPIRTFENCPPFAPTLDDLRLRDGDIDYEYLLKILKEALTRPLTHAETRYLERCAFVDE